MSKPYRIIKHPLVENDIYSIASYVSDYAGVHIGFAKATAIVAFIDRLVDFPQVGSLRHDIAKDLRAIPAGGKSVVCFKVDETDRTVFIICVTYAGADWVSRVNERQ
ncbi:type II toxin-antitoxin system RelE/ParE family toxin [Pararhizobium antarcticum]|uniref:Plasmid stabilization protein n=1 Tax=Pararhizobium antarcticum TaxID=1798805 RepID=A0A657LY00_9HYPH|nr:type II toxin-antitoxin system RelE/ParE family toxin [Pararhizobium antarcticum]OJF90416.1 plasmid stabilization protein [Rhizobium sp. 58]OJG00521.1 plasmid stabilization protein [Pararhizobium antarcticum]